MHLHVIIVAAMTVSASAAEVMAQTASDSAAIRATALAYVEGWYEGNAERMGRAASVRATMSGWIDYMHMAKVDGRWQIVNVLWEFHPPAKR